MIIQLNNSENVPYYAQIVGQIRYQVASGRLEAGDQLPTIRQLAEELTVNPNTVARAYRELEAAGVVAAKRGAGVFVTDKVSPLSKKEKLRVVTEHIDSLLVAARQLGIDVDTLVRIIKQRNKKL